jgi:hypothetical protein
MPLLSAGRGMRSVLGWSGPPATYQITIVPPA